MNRKRVFTTLALAGPLIVLLLGSAVLAIGIPTIDWWVIGGGGGHTEAGIYTLDATIGQAVAGVAADGSSELCSGFWCGVVEATPTPTPTATPTSTSTATATPTSTAIHTATPTATPTGTSTTTPTPTSTATPTTTPTATPTATPTSTPTATPTGTATPPTHLIYLPIVLKNYHP